MVLDRVEQPEAGRRVVLGNDYDLGPALLWPSCPVVEPEDRLNQRKTATGLKNLVHLLELVTCISVHPLGLVDPVRRFQVEEGPRGDADHQALREINGVRGIPGFRIESRGTGRSGIDKLGSPAYGSTRN